MKERGMKMNFKSDDKVIFIESCDELRKLNKGYVYTILNIPLKNDFIVLDNGYTVKENEIILLSNIKENVPIHLRDDLEYLEVYGKYALASNRILDYSNEEFIITKIEDKDTLLISPKNYRNLTFSVSPEMCIFDGRTIALSKFNVGDRVKDSFDELEWEIIDYVQNYHGGMYLCYNQSFMDGHSGIDHNIERQYKDTKYGKHLWWFEDYNLSHCEPNEHLKEKNKETKLTSNNTLDEKEIFDVLNPHKGCKFDNNDFYRAFTNKNGNITFNQIKVSTVCICTVEDAAGEKNIFFATYKGKRIKKQGTMVKLKNGMIGEVNDSFKVMDKYLKSLVMTLNLYTANIMYPIQEIVEIMEDN
jgi:hypothetical protein